MTSLAASSGANPGAIIGGIFAGLVVLFLYWLPTLIAVSRRREIPNLGSVIVINLFLGATGVGWVVALAMAVRSQPRPVMMVPQQPWPPQHPQYPQPPPQPGGNGPGLPAPPGYR